jgi:dienelactone hydrolase
MKKRQPVMLAFRALIIILVILKAEIASGQSENLKILDNWIEWSDGKNMLIHYLNRQAFKYLDEREKEIAALKTKEEWMMRQSKVREILMKIVGPFPEKTPLNARVTGIVKKDGFRIEKIIYESMPEFYVTACLFIPDGIKGKRPAIIHVSGHSFLSFRTPETQKQIYNLVRKGFIVFAIDPLSQGERVQYWDSQKNGSMMGTSPSGEHRYAGNQMYISGVSPGRYFIWDGIRAVDYLFTRKEVDSGRIGIFGCSGGGTQTTYIAAFDERIKAAAPGCYITGFRRLLESIGADDPEQNFFHGLKYGISQEDLLELRAPRPIMISSTTRDFFSIQGAMEVFSEVRQAYKAFGKEENAMQVIDDAGHGFNRNITAIYAFFQRMLDLPGNSGEESFDGFLPEDLRITGTGQISTSLGGVTAFSLNKKESETWIEKIMESRKNMSLHLDKVVAEARELSGFSVPDSKIRSVFRGRYQRDGYAVEMYAIQGDGNYVIPLLLFVPKNRERFSSLIYLNPGGKAADASPGGRIEKLVKAGYMVAAPDLLGTGEVRSDEFFIWNCNISVLTGESLVGVQAGNIIKVADFLKERDDVVKESIGAIVYDELCPSMLHAAAFDRSITPVILSGTLLSYSSLVLNRFYDLTYYNYAVAGSLHAYDLPDLMGCIAPRKLALLGMKDQMKQPASALLTGQELSFPRNVYSHLNISDKLYVSDSDHDLMKIVSWGFDSK